MFKKNWMLGLLVTLMLAVSLFVLTSCNKPDPIDEDPIDEVVLPVPVDQIESLALKEGCIPSIFKVGDEIDFTEAKLLITLKVPVSETEEESGDAEPPVEIAITADMVADFATTAVGSAVMRIIYTTGYEVNHDYEVISESTFFISYELNSGEFVPKYIGEPGSEVLVPVTTRFDSETGLAEIEQPIRQYYNFAGWYTDAEFTPVNLTNALAVGLEADVTLYASWTPINYTLTFVTDYLSVSTVNYTVQSGIIALPVIDTDGIEQGEYDIEPESLVFAGWYETSNYTAISKKATVNASTPQNITFYAKWEPKVTLSLNAGFENRYQQGTSAPAVATAKLTLTDYYGAVINNNIAVTAAMVSGFSAVETGEYTLRITYKYGTLDYTVDVGYEVTANNVFYISYTLNQGVLPENAADRFVKEDGLATLPVPTRTAYDFAGWYTTANFTPIANFRDSIAPNTNVTTATKTLALFAKWTPTVYNVNYYLNSGTTFERVDTYTVLSSLALWSGATREGYHFLGWYDNAAYNGEPLTAIEISNYGAKAYYAKWGAKVTNVTITSSNQFNVKNGQMQLTSTVLPGGSDPAVYPDVTYKIVSQRYNGVQYYTGVQYISVGSANVIENGVFIAYKAGYVIIQATADGINSAEFTIKVIVDDVEEINVLNSPLVVFPGISKRIELSFEPFTAIPNTNLDYSQMSFVITSIPEEWRDHVTITNDGVINAAIGLNTAFSFTVRITYNQTSGAKSIDKIFNVPQSVSTVQQLNNIRNNLTGYYVLTADIDLAGEDWVPIGYVEQINEQLNYDNSFKGMLFGGDNGSGNAYRIKNLTIDAANVTYITAGLFGAIDKAHIEGVILENISITGTCAANTYYIGGIAGVNRLSKVQDCIVTGVIDIVGARYIGGIVGQMYGSMSNIKTYLPNINPLEEDYTLSITVVQLNSSNLSVGGLVGLFLNGVITDADVVGTITVIDCLSARVGGIVGDSKDRIFNSSVNVVISVSETSAVKTNIISVGGIVGTTTENVGGLTAIVDITINAKGVVYAGGIAGVA
ncbi:MAG: hypothetical protein EOM87_05620, partial [Clostridia bacterium]|nr:hypothetical protein [Clostridia bacterium]